MISKNAIKVPKVFKQTDKITWYKTLGTLQFSLNLPRATQFLISKVVALDLFSLLNKLEILIYCV